MIPLKPILERCHRDLVERDKDAPWDNPRQDAVYLSLYVGRLVDQVRRLNADRSIGVRMEPLDLCPVCAGDTWGRPLPPDAVGNPDFKGDRHDFTRRECHDCGEIRPEPDDA